MKKYNDRQMRLIIDKLRSDIAEAINIKYKDVIEKRAVEFESTEIYSLIKNCETLQRTITLTKEELIFRDKKYSLREIEKIGGHTRT